MTEKINITDIDKLQITKVKSYKIHFTYDGVKYFILADTDEESHISLFRKEPLGKEKFEVIHMNGKVTSGGVGQFLKDISKRRAHHTVYACLDKQYFIKQLVAMGFSTGLFEEEYNDYRKESDAIHEKIKQLRAELTELSKGWEATSGHGSKTDKLQHELKLKACERVKGAQAGEYCEEYKEVYGAQHKEYGGVLTDLFSLPYGTYFYVTTGEYYAAIGYDKHGDKTVITNKSEVTLTKEHHSAYIILDEYSFL